MTREMRAGKPEERLALKSAVKRALRLAGGGESFQHATRVNAPQLSLYGARQEEIRHMPVDVVLDLDRECEEPVITRVLAGLLGYVLVKLPKGANGEGPWYRHIAEIATDVGEVVSKLGEALKDDGEVSGSEVKALKLREQIEAAIEELASLRLEIEHVEEKPE